MNRTLPANVERLPIMPQCRVQDDKRAPDVTDRDWPLRSHLVLGPLPTAVPCARLHARQVVWEWGMRELCESVELIVSELVTNAITASAQCMLPVRLWVLSDGSQVLIMVHDANPNPPVPMHPDDRAEGGRGADARGSPERTVGLVCGNGRYQRKSGVGTVPIEITEIACATCKRTFTCDVESDAARGHLQRLRGRDLAAQLAPCQPGVPPGWQGGLSDHGLFRLAGPDLAGQAARGPGASGRLEAWQRPLP